MQAKSPHLIAFVLLVVFVIGGGLAVFTMRNNFVVENTAAAPHEPVVYLTAQDKLNPQELVAPEAQPKVKVLSNEVGYLNVRQGPGTSNAKVGTVDIGDEFEYTETKDNWYHIVLKEGETGWVSGDYVQEIATEDS